MMLLGHGRTCGWRVVQCLLQVEDVVDDVLDDFQFGEFLVAWHIRDQVLQFAQQFLHLLCHDHVSRGRVPLLDFVLGEDLILAGRSADAAAGRG